MNRRSFLAGAGVVAIAGVASAKTPAIKPPTQKPLGISPRYPTETSVYIGDSVNVGDFITVDKDNRAIRATRSDRVIGVALQSGNRDDLISVRVLTI